LSESVEAPPPAPGPAAPPELPLTFRQELLQHIFPTLTAGWSCAVVGLAGGGLSNLLRFAAEPRVSAHYLGSEAPNTLLVHLEADRLPAGGPVYIALARQLLAGARRQRWPRAEQAALRSLAETPTGGNLAEPAEPLAGMLAFLCGQQGRRVIFVCDEFDALLLQRPAAELRELRALRDMHKYRLAFLAGFRREPGRLLAERPAETGAQPPAAARLAELFEQHTFPLRPYSRADADTPIDRKTVGWPQAPSAEQREALFRAAGGHAKLLVAALVYLQPRLHLPWPNIERGLLAEPGLSKICAALWHSLEPAEQLAAWQLAADDRDAISPESLGRLQLRGLAIGGPAFIFSTVFENFLRTQSAPSLNPAQSETPSQLRDPSASVNW
jgi:hypothetical protein